MRAGVSQKDHMGSYEGQGENIRSTVAAAVGTTGTGGALAEAFCSFALTDNCESEACRKRIRLKRRVLGVCSCTGGVVGRSSWLSAPHEGLPTSLEEDGRPPSTETAPRSGVRCSVDLSMRLVKKPAGSRVLRRWRSRSLRFGRSALRGIALTGTRSSSTQILVGE